MNWHEMTSPDIDRLDRDRTIVILPCGSVEQHGRHMPLGTDTMLAAAVADGAADLIGAGTTILVMPPPWYGFSPHHMAFAGTVTLRSEVYIGLVKDIAASVFSHGFKRLALVNGHGGNSAILEVIGADLGREWHGRARIATVTYFALVGHRTSEFRESATGGMGHAGEFETSLMLHLGGGTVQAERAATCYPDAGSGYLTTDLFGRAAARTYLDFSDLSSTGTLGDPSLASAEKGERIYRICVEELARFLADFADWPITRAASAAPGQDGSGA